jgi:hypothetical protein
MAHQGGRKLTFVWMSGDEWSVVYELRYQGVLCRYDCYAARGLRDVKCLYSSFFLDLLRARVLGQLLFL